MLLLCLRSTVLIIDRLNKVDDIVSVDPGSSSVISLMDGVKIGITQTLLSGPVCIFIILLRVLQVKVRHNYTEDRIIFNFRAANLSQGLWTAPYFDCDGLVKKWLITYVSPFFGWNSLRNRIEFK